MSNLSAPPINDIHSSLCPPAAIDILCSAQGIPVQLLSTMQALYPNCSVEIGCRMRMKSGCAKLQHGVVAGSNSATPQNM